MKKLLVILFIITLPILFLVLSMIITSPIYDHKELSKVYKVLQEKEKVKEYYFYDLPYEGIYLLKPRLLKK